MQHYVRLGTPLIYMTVMCHRISSGIIYTSENTPLMKTVYRSPKYPNNMK